MTVRYPTPCVWCGERDHKPGSSWRTTDDGHRACSQKCEDEWCTASAPDSVHAMRAEIARLRAALSTPAIEGGDEYRRGVEDAARVADEHGEGIGNVGDRIRALASKECDRIRRNPAPDAAPATKEET